MARFDGAVIDASADGLAKLPHEGADCPLAVGHLFNHPPADVAPSVVPCAVDFDADVPHDLVPLLPNVHYLPASEQQLLASNQQQLLLGEGATRTDGITQQSLLLGDGAKRTWSDAATELVQASLADMSDEPRVGDGEAVRLRGLARRDARASGRGAIPQLSPQPGEPAARLVHARRPRGGQAAMEYVESLG